MDAEFDTLGIMPDKKADVSGLVDRREKMEAGPWEANAKEIGLTTKQLDGLKTILDDKERWQKSKELVRLFETLESLGVRQYVRFEPNIMRGLLYYTGTVFEAFDFSGGIRRAILGGGRYDNLLGDVGGEPIPAVGFAMGDVVISLILKELKLTPTLPITPANVLVTTFSSDLVTDSLTLSADLRAKGINVTCYPEPAKLPKQFKFADRMGMRVVLVIGPDEAKDGKVTVKNLASGTQETISRSKVLESVNKILESK
jgi:histidyl-tRNA synthetase